MTPASFCNVVNNAIVNDSYILLNIWRTCEQGTWRAKAHGPLATIQPPMAIWWLDLRVFFF